MFMFAKIIILASINNRYENTLFFLAHLSDAVTKYFAIFCNKSNI